MKKLKLLVCFVPGLIHAEICRSEEVIKELFSSPQESKEEIRPEGPKKLNSSGLSNLPAEIRTRTFNSSDSLVSRLITPDSGMKERLDGIAVGDELNIIVYHSVIAFRDEDSPVIAVVADGRFQGAKLIGTAKLDRNSSKILINFHGISTRSRTFSTAMAGFSRNGQRGFEGYVHSKELSLFTGEFISNMVAAYFDGLTPRNTNPFGQVVQDNSIGAATRQGLSAGALSSARLFQEKLRNAPEFAEIDGPIYGKAIVLDEVLSGRIDVKNGK